MIIPTLASLNALRVCARLCVGESEGGGESALPAVQECSLMVTMATHRWLTKVICHCW